jgi:hypothetical protein
MRRPTTIALAAALVLGCAAAGPAFARFDGGWPSLRLETKKPPKSIDELRKAPPHPVDLGSYVVGKPLIALLGADLGQLDAPLSGPGQGRIIGDAYVGTSCMRHACPDADVLILITLTDRKPFVVWRNGSDMTAKPSLGEWPAEMRQLFEQWRARTLR